MDRHLVDVKVSVESGTDQRVYPYGLAFDQFWLERLYTQPVESGRSIQHDRMLFNDLVKNIPHLQLFAFDYSFSALYSMEKPFFFKLLYYERFKKFQRHLFL